MGSEGDKLPILKGSVQTPKFTTAEITDSDDRIHYVPIKHTIGEYFLTEIDGKYFAFSMKGARILTYRSKSGIGKSFQVIQYDTSHYASLSPTTKELELMLEANSLPKMDRTMFDIFSILARREGKDFGKYMVGERVFDTKKQAQKYFEGLKNKFTIENEGLENEKKIHIEIKHNIHQIQELVKIFEDEKGEFPDQVREIKKYLTELDKDEIVTPLRRITDFIQETLIATIPSFLGESAARIQRLDGTLREVTNVPIKPKGNLGKYMLILMPVVIGGLLIAMGVSEGWFDGIIDFIENLGVIQEGFKDTGLGNIGTIQQKNTGGADYSDATLMATYPDCTSMTDAINGGTLDYNKMSSSMKGLVDTC